MRSQNGGGNNQNNRIPNDRGGKSVTKATIGFAMCGSFCTFSKAFEQMRALVEDGYDVIPIMSGNASSTDTRFGKASEMIERAEEITGKRVLTTAVQTEPIGPKKLCDLLVIAPCTGNTLAKLSLGVTDTSVTMAAKSHLRVLRPVLLCVATNDALGASAQNIGRLLNTKNIYFVPLKQDDPVKKPNSLVADFNKLKPCVEAALENRQVQPVFE
ncbi:MAG: dipicolinate synthase subunit B [Ruminococcus sp.]|jgi:dipicolinate synthase subunit B|uniref:Dipicolinate synthase subunit B n=1 Tax=Ruminococcus difficilis TaxID=2763069 RepID=A0A934WRM3_9FIRM|nr:dipicolinate synthase subunit B [Ruminococcus difficilis]MBQ1354543.1 dipicolinate synthase subunit B [Ruminococcus sp.]MBQ1586567.1 dipicolinate synthase subunit B [Ruminococcus sp.]MBQ1595266.1 dipicolinate synthase subunit B [Ruminococcus sp.]MBQ1717234.1 dipicolinate synthase subunit B [Ruminococcus sp.]